MPYFKQNKVLLIHIPKTGGTSIEKYFANKNGIKLNPSCLYYSYYANSVQNDVDKLRKSWKKKMAEEKTNLEEKEEDLFQQLDFFSNQQFEEKSSKDNSQNSNERLQKIKENLPEFKLFRRVRLCKELQHSLQHLTWIEMQKYSEIFSDFVRACLPFF